MATTLVFLPPMTDKHRAWADRLATELPGLEILVAEDEAEARDAMQQADAAFGTLTPALLSTAEKLRWLQAPLAAPPVGYYFPELISHRVVVTNLRGPYTEQVATHATAFVLALARGFQRYLPQQAKRVWRQDRSPETVIHLPVSTLLLVGVGAVRELIATQCRAFGMRIVGVDARLTEHPDIEIHRPDALDDLIPSADVVVLTVPHTPKTEAMMNAHRFRLMKKSAVFVNIGRGGTVRLADLVEALEAGALAGAALDVFEVEPLPENHPLWEAPNVLLTPHVAGAGPFFEERQYEIVADNVRRFLAGKELRNLVDKAEWY